MTLERLGEVEATPVAKEPEEASYSYLQMNLKKAPNSLDVGTAPFVEGSSPRHQVSVQSSFNLTKALNLDLTFRYVSALRALVVKPYSTGYVA